MALVIRTTDRGIFKRCRQQWDFTSKIRQNWEPVQRYLAFDFGTSIHEGLRAYYDPAIWGDLEAQRSAALLAFEATLVGLQQKVRMGAIEIERRFDEEVHLGLEMLKYYFLWAPRHDNFVPRFVEVEFEVEIPGLDVPYQGRIDLIAEDEYGYWIVDHKTASQFGGVEWLALDDQCASYAWAIWKKLGLEVRGVIYNQLKKSPPHPPKPLKRGGFSVAKNQDTTFEVYLHTLREAGIDPHYYRDFLLYLKQNPKDFIRRTKVTYGPRVMDIVEQRIQQEAREMINPDVQIYPSPSPWNCNGCRFFGPCVQVNEGYVPFMDDNYTHVRS